MPDNPQSDLQKSDLQTDPFEEGERAARENIPAEGNPYQDGTEEYALWSAGRELRRRLRPRP